MVRDEAADEWDEVLRMAAVAVVLEAPWTGRAKALDRRGSPALSASVFLLGAGSGTARWSVGRTAHDGDGAAWKGRERRTGGAFVLERVDGRRHHGAGIVVRRRHLEQAGRRGNATGRLEAGWSHCLRRGGHVSSHGRRRCVSMARWGVDIPCSLHCGPWQRVLYKASWAARDWKALAMRLHEREVGCPQARWTITLL